ncbi:SWIB/MDM2 domain-containing protein [bacterium]|jgi:upstream activation factor subunit UAF30|nr:SWIB/MDM2 domain-containing protein [bacterium]
MPPKQKQPKNVSTPAPKAKKAAAPKKAPAAPKKEVPVEPVPAETPVEEPVDSVVPQISNDFLEFMTKLQAVNQMLSSLKADFRVLEKKATRELKAAEKASAKKKRKAGNRSPSGFVKPTKISDDLASFLSKPKGSEMARTEVTREINTYIRTHKLQDKENGRKINADKKLTALLSLGAKDELTYFNLQKFMSPHFAKAGQPIPASNM